ncbi:MAG: CvpA family protein [Deltaproteobacteria bacterium]|nr:CvpA family protein [Deltaproteobacteria bacterium]
MNTLDIVFIVIIGASVIYSLIRGLVREIFSFLSIILGFFAASYGASSWANWLRRWVENETLGQILGFAILFILVALSISLLGKALSRLVKKMDLSFADRLGGAAFGFLKAILLIAIALLVLTAFLPPKSKTLSDSQIAPVAVTIARGLSYLVPEKLGALYMEKEKELKKYWAAQELAGGKNEAKGEKR